jgi:hypothetical protein
MKICSRCLQEKLLNSFDNNKNYVDGKNIYCKLCRNKDYRTWYCKKYGKTEDQIRKIVKVIDGHKLCSRCKQSKIIANFGKGNSSRCGLSSWCKECNNNYNIITSRITRMEFILAYGGKCNCCGETELSLLTIEHIRGKGHKLIYDSMTRLLRQLKALNWPEGYTVLCFNCNLSTAYGRPCIHTKEYVAYEKEFEEFLINDKRLDKYNELATKLNERRIRNG